jgi:MFS family permease
MPLTLTVLSASVPAERRGLALGIWGGISGLAVALGPLVGGAIVSGISWHWIFWLNVPIGLALAPLILLRLDESRGPAVPARSARSGPGQRRPRRDRVGSGPRQRGRLDLPGIVGSFVVGARCWCASSRGSFARSIRCSRCASSQPDVRAGQRRQPAHVLRHVRRDLLHLAVLSDRAGALAVQSGLRILPWTAMPMLVAPIAGALSDRIGGHRLMGAGLALQAIGLAWIAAVSTPTTPYVEFIGPFLISGVGMALFFAPVAHVVLSSVRPEQEGQASGANNAIRELGGVFGVAVLAAVFTVNGGYGSGQQFVDGMNPAVMIGAALVAVGAIAAFAIKRSPQTEPLALVDQAPFVTACACASCWCAPPGETADSRRPGRRRREDPRPRWGFVRHAPQVRRGLPPRGRGGRSGQAS